MVHRSWIDPFLDAARASGIDYGSASTSAEMRHPALVGRTESDTRQPFDLAAFA